MDRRSFLAGSAAAMAAPGDGSAPRFSTGDRAWQATYDKALAVLAGNVQTMPGYAKPVLIEGAAYSGIWMECGPHEALLYRSFRPDIARNSHTCFFDLQKPDGQFPCNTKTTGTGFGQIQMVVPLAATAWELARATGDEALLKQAYDACAAWDAWLLRYRNTRGTGLTEGFCTYDTGHDNSPRWAGVPVRCPDADARRFPEGFGVPRLCPDLSATTYGARHALAGMARALGRNNDAARWEEQAETLRKTLLERLYFAEDAAFYDIDAAGRVVRIRSDILSRVCGEHVPDQALFDDLWTRQIHARKAFWPPLPLPSIAMDDPAFIRPIIDNSWGGPSQALTALRAPRWMEHYGRAAEFAQMMDAWCRALIADGTFRQQADPLDSRFTAKSPVGYSPAALVMLEFTWRLAGIVEENGELWWNVRPNHSASRRGRFRLTTDAGRSATMTYDRHGADLAVNGRTVARIDGVARLVTDLKGASLALVGISEAPQPVVVRRHGKARRFILKANQRVAL